MKIEILVLGFKGLGSLERSLTVFSTLFSLSQAEEARKRARAWGEK